MNALVLQDHFIIPISYYVKAFVVVPSKLIYVKRVSLVLKLFLLLIFLRRLLYYSFSYSFIIFIPLRCDQLLCLLNVIPIQNHHFPSTTSCDLFTWHCSTNHRYLHKLWASQYLHKTRYTTNGETLCLSVNSMTMMVVVSPNCMLFPLTSNVVSTHCLKTEF